MLLGVQVTDVRRGYLGGRRPAPAPGLHHDYGQITTSVVLLGVQVPAPAPAPGLHLGCGQITARSQPLCCHAWEATRAGGQTMGQSMWTRKLLGVKSCGDQSMWTRESLAVKAWSKDVDTGVARGQRGSKHVVAGVSGDQSMWTRKWLGVSGSQIMLTRESLGVSGDQIMSTREWLGSAGVKSC